MATQNVDPLQGPTLKRSLDITTESASQASPKRPRPSASFVANDALRLGTFEDLLFQCACDQLKDFAKHQYPVFEHGVELGWFAIAAHEMPASCDARVAIQSWLSRYHTDEMRKVKNDNGQDWIGVLVAAVLSDSKHNRVTTIQYLAYEAVIPGVVWLLTHPNLMLNKLAPATRAKVDQAFDSCLKIHDKLKPILMLMSMNVISDLRISLEECEALWRDMKYACTTSEYNHSSDYTIKKVVAIINRLPPSRLKEQFERFGRRLEMGDFKIDASTTKRTQSDDVDCVQRLRRLLNDCDELREGCQVDFEMHGGPARACRAIGYMGTSINEQRDALGDVEDLVSRHELLIKCNLDALAAEGHRMDRVLFMCS